MCTDGSNRVVSIPAEDLPMTTGPVTTALAGCYGGFGSLNSSWGTSEPAGAANSRRFTSLIAKKKSRPFRGNSGAFSYYLTVCRPGINAFGQATSKRPGRRYDTRAPNISPARLAG